LTVRVAREEDAPELVEIYRPYVEGTAITFECDVPGAGVFAGRIRDTLTRYPYLVAVVDGKIAGYAYASAYKPRAAYDWTVETSVYVRAGLRGRGIGARLYRALEDALKRMNIQNLTACITYPNPESVGFHERAGFRTVGYFSKAGFKMGAWHDVVWMEKFLGDHETPPESVVPFPKLQPEGEGLGPAGRV